MEKLPYSPPPFATTPGRAYATAAVVLAILGFMLYPDPSSALGASAFAVPLSVGMMVHGMVLSDGLDSLKKNAPEDYREGYVEGGTPNEAVGKIYKEAMFSGTKYGLFAFVVFFVGMLFGSWGT